MLYLDKYSTMGGGTMATLKGVVLKRLIDFSQAHRPKWLARTLDDKNVLIDYENGELRVKFDGSNDVFKLEVSSGATLTTEVMLLLTGLSVLGQ